MKAHYFILPFFFLFFASTTLQSQSALDFDGVDDQITVANASGLIANLNMSLSMWVYPRNPAPSFPDFDGFAGFRNNFNADFYILHYTTTSVEARFRNSQGQVFDVIYNGLELNTWNHFTLTYDGETLILYHNGEAAGSTPANGYITSTAEPLNIGFTPYYSDPYWFDGQLDDVCLWNKGLTEPEVVALYNENCQIDLEAQGLVLCYQFEEGLPGEDNSAIFKVTDAMANIDGDIFNMDLMGDASNYVYFLHTGYTYLEEATCGDPYTSPSGNYTWTETGVYSDTIPSGSCIDVYFVALEVITPDTSVTQDSPYSLTANFGGAEYQWIDCGTGDEIPGATGQTFEAPEPGSYAVEVTYNGCSGISSCFDLVVNSTYSPLEKDVKLFPNPVNDQLALRLEETLHEFTIEIADANGRIVFLNKFTQSHEVKMDVSELANGMYFLRLIAGDQAEVVRFLRIQD